MMKQNKLKPSKIKSAVAKFSKIAVLVSSLMLAPKANAQDSTTANLSLTPKATMRIYDNTKTPAIGAGLDLQSDINKLSIGASATLVQTPQKLEIEETSVWIGYPIGPIYAVGYAYTDRFYNVGIKDPAFGIALKGYGIKLGMENCKDFSDIYIKFPTDNITPGLVLLEWDGKIQRMGLSLSTTNTLGPFSIGTEAQYTCPPSGGTGSLQFRTSIRYPL